MTRKEADALISYIEFMASLTEEHELLNRPPSLNIMLPKESVAAFNNSVIYGADFGTDDAAKAAITFRDQFDKWHVEEAGPIDPEAFKKLKTPRGKNMQFGTLLNMVAGNKNQMLDYYPKATILNFGKVVRDLTEMELKEGATTRFKCPNPEGQVSEAIILWPSLNDEYIYLPKDYKI